MNLSDLSGATFENNESEYRAIATIEQDTLDGGEGDDGLEGDDNIYGSAGADLIDGGGGNNNIFGNGVDHKTYVSGA